MRRLALLALIATSAAACARGSELGDEPPRDAGLGADETPAPGDDAGDAASAADTAEERVADAPLDASDDADDDASDAVTFDVAFEAAFDAGVDATRADAATEDASSDASVDAGVDAGLDAGLDAGADVGVDAGVDAGRDAGVDSGVDSGLDAGGACRAKIVVNEVKTDVPWIELYNTGTCTVNLAGYELDYRSATGTTDQALWRFSGGQLASHAFFLAAGASYVPNPPADVYVNAVAIDASKGGVALRDASGQIVDSVGWGNAANAFVEGSPAISPIGGESIARSPDGWDTGSNYDDFVGHLTPTPRAKF